MVGKTSGLLSQRTLKGSSSFCVQSLLLAFRSVFQFRLAFCFSPLACILHTPHPPPHFPLFFMRYYFIILLLHLIFIAATKSHNHVGALPVVRWCRKSFEKSGEQLVSSNLTDVWQPCALLSRTCKLFLHLTEKTSLLTNKVAFTIPMALHVILLWTQLPSKQQFWCEYVHISNSLGFQDIPVVCQCFFYFHQTCKVNLFCAIFFDSPKLELVIF